MKNSKRKPYFPNEIQLRSNPLVEAWLEIRWKLQTSRVINSLPDGNFLVDSQFPFALGVFDRIIREKFPHREALPASSAPEDILPFVARYRFWTEQGKWPVVQFGPGVATLNFTSPYKWEMFKAYALDLQKSLLGAYSSSELQTEMLVLKYRNAFKFESDSVGVLEFLAQNLNTNLQIPKQIPSLFGSSQATSDINISASYDLVEPNGRGSIQLVTGLQHNTDPVSGNLQVDPVIVCELGVQSVNSDLSKVFANQDRFEEWLTAAHSVIHEWFFALIDGDLRKQFEE